MKNIYTCLIALTLSYTTTAQSTFGFDNYPLVSESYDNGSAQNGDFIFNQTESISLSNTYDTIWGGVWSGFSLSNITDNTTAGWSNQYSAYPGSGSNASENYAIFYGSGLLAAESAATEILEFKISNATYAALSMRDGDFFGKQFGSPLNANGIADGTNGEDYFRVWIIGESSIGTKDSIEFYLADYRFADSTQDYILNTWETIDLTVMPFPVVAVSFRLESSDSDNAGGFFTPAYFAMDDVKTGSTSGLNENKELIVSVYPNPATDQVFVKGGSGDLKIISAQGQIVYQVEHTGASIVSVQDLPSGIYAIQVQSASGSYTNRLIVQ